MQKITDLTQKILANGMDYEVTWKSLENGVASQVRLLDSRGEEIKTSTGESFEKCMEEIGVYFEN